LPQQNKDSELQNRIYSCIIFTFYLVNYLISLGEYYTQVIRNVKTILLLLQSVIDRAVDGCLLYIND